MNPAAEPPSASLRLSGPSERLRAATQEHDKLVEKVARKRRELERLRMEARAATTAVAGRVGQLADEWRRLDESIHALFDELLGGKRSRRARSQIRRVYLDLQDAGVVSVRSEVDGATDEPWPDFDAPPGEEPRNRGAHREGRHATPSAPKHHDRGALRDLYRRLVELLHPDQVQDESDKARRTEAMKDVTVAFRESDFGRLIEIERAWATASSPLQTEDDIDRRWAGIEAQNRELRKQLRTLDRELRAFRRSPEGLLVHEVDRAGGLGREHVVAQAVAEAAGELQRVRELRDFVGAFRDGRITLAEFLAGPAAIRDDDEHAGSEEELAAAFADFLNLVEEQLATRVTNAKSRGRGPVRQAKQDSARPRPGTRRSR